MYNLLRDYVKDSCEKSGLVEVGRRSYEYYLTLNIWVVAKKVDKH